MFSEGTVGVEVPFTCPGNALEFSLESLTLSETHRGVRGVCGGVECSGEGGKSWQGGWLGIPRAVQQGMGHRGHKQALALHV